MVYTTFLIHRFLPWAAHFITNDEEVLHSIKETFCLFAFDGESPYKAAFECEVQYSNMQYYISITNREMVTVGSLNEVCGYVAHLAFMPDYIRNESLVYLHGASLVHKTNKKAIALIGATGSGKTTLCASLLCSGEWQYLSDDIIALDATNGHVIPWPKCMYVREWSLVQSMSNVAVFLECQQPQLVFNGETKSILVPKVCYDAPEAALDRFFFIHRDSSMTQCLFEKLSASEAFTKMLMNLRDPVNLKVDKIISIVKKNSFYTLEYDESERAVNLLNGIDYEY